ncbi:glycosyltransferase 87 family protein [Kitasatospora sp. NPDC001540]|uniref:glycosyltransferase 87 family protein n=1 Tax=Kitasatospora sp. NPDC001540 TaxID=3364014 RepID=UPI0036B45BD2
MLSQLGPHRVWGALAAGGYLLAAVVALLPGVAGAGRSGWVALGGAGVLPLALLVGAGSGQSEVAVLARAGDLLLAHGSPYLDAPAGPGEVTPYLPGMALFGLPHALLRGGGAAGDPRWWCAAAFLAALWAAWRALSARGGPRRVGVVALLASPPVALALAVSGVDLPLTGLLCLALALGAARRPTGAGLALAAAGALKWTAWPAVAVVVALLAATAGRRAAARCAGVAATGTAALVVPWLLRAPGPLVCQVFAFPLDRGGWPTPAASPLPGRLLADLGPAGWGRPSGCCCSAGRWWRSRCCCARPGARSRRPTDWRSVWRWRSCSPPPDASATWRCRCSCPSSSDWRPAPAPAEPPAPAPFPSAAPPCRRAAVLPHAQQRPCQ